MSNEINMNFKDNSRNTKKNISQHLDSILNFIFHLFPFFFFPVWEFTG